METQEQKGGNLAAIATMFALFFMIAFVTNFASPMGVIAKNQFNASNALSQLGNFANFFAYLFMGIPGGLILKRKGYKFTALTAVAVGFTGLAIQLLSGYVSSFPVYVIGAFVAGFSMCMLNLVTNPLLNTLGGGGKKGNQLVQFGCSLNSVGATLSPMVLGWLIGEITKDTAFGDARPALLIAMGIFAVAFVIVGLSEIPEPHMETAEEKALRLSGGVSVFEDIAATLKFRHFTLGALAIFFYIVIEVGVPSMGMLYMTQCVKNAAGEIVSKGPGYVGGTVAGVVCGAYWFLMMCGRLLGGVVGGSISSRVQVSFLATLGIALLLAVMFSPVKMITLFGYSFPLSMAFMVAVGLCTSVMWGGIFNMAAEGLGKYVPMGSGIFMAMVFGGVLIPVQGMIADKVGILGSYWFTVGLLAYVLFYALIGSRVTKRNDGVAL